MDQVMEETIEESGNKTWNHVAESSTSFSLVDNVSIPGDSYVLQSSEVNSVLCNSVQEECSSTNMEVVEEQIIGPVLYEEETNGCDFEPECGQDDSSLNVECVPPFSNNNSPCVDKEFLNNRTEEVSSLSKTETICSTLEFPSYDSHDVTNVLCTNLDKNEIVTDSETIISEVANNEEISDMEGCGDLISSSVGEELVITSEIEIGTVEEEITVSSINTKEGEEKYSDVNSESVNGLVDDVDINHEKQESLGEVECENNSLSTEISLSNAVNLPDDSDKEERVGSSTPLISESRGENIETGENLAEDKTEWKAAEVDNSENNIIEGDPKTDSNVPACHEPNDVTTEEETIVQEHPANQPDSPNFTSNIGECNSSETKDNVCTYNLQDVDSKLEEDISKCSFDEGSVGQTSVECSNDNNVSHSLKNDTEVTSHTDCPLETQTHTNNSDASFDVKDCENIDSTSLVDEAMVGDSCIDEINHEMTSSDNNQELCSQINETQADEPVELNSTDVDLQEKPDISENIDDSARSPDTKTESLVEEMEVSDCVEGEHPEKDTCPESLSPTAVSTVDEAAHEDSVVKEENDDKCNSEIEYKIESMEIETSVEERHVDTHDYSTQDSYESQDHNSLDNDSQNNDSNFSDEMKDYIDDEEEEDDDEGEEDDDDDDDDDDDEEEGEQKREEALSSFGKTGDSDDTNSRVDNFESLLSKKRLKLSIEDLEDTPLSELLKLLKSTKKSSQLSPLEEPAEKKRYQCSYCEETFSRQVTKEAHEKEHQMLYKCVSCHLTFQTHPKLLKHRAEVHDEFPFYCSFCSKSCASVHSWNKHMKESHAHCAKCKSFFKTLDDMKNHKCLDTPESSEEVDKVQCDTSEKGDSNRIQYDFPIIKKTRGRPKKFKDGEEVGEVKKPKRTYIKRRFFYDGALSNSPQEGESSGPFICPVCSNQFENKNSLILHQALRHPGFRADTIKQPPFVCLICSKEFKDKGSMICHQGMEHPGQPISMLPRPTQKKICRACFKVFDTQIDMSKHVCTGKFTSSFPGSQLKKNFSNMLQDVQISRIPNQSNNTQASESNENRTEVRNPLEPIVKIKTEDDGVCERNSKSVEDKNKKFNLSAKLLDLPGVSIKVITKDGETRDISQPKVPQPPKVNSTVLKIPKPRPRLEIQNPRLNKLLGDKKSVTVFPRFPARTGAYRPRPEGVKTVSNQNFTNSENKTAIRQPETVQPPIKIKTERDAEASESRNPVSDPQSEQFGNVTQGSEALRSGIQNAAPSESTTMNIHPPRFMNFLPHTVKPTAEPPGLLRNNLNNYMNNKYMQNFTPRYYGYQQPQIRVRPETQNNLYHNTNSNMQLPNPLNIPQSPIRIKSEHDAFIRKTPSQRQHMSNFQPGLLNYPPPVMRMRPDNQFMNNPFNNGHTPLSMPTARYFNNPPLPPALKPIPQHHQNIPPKNFYTPEYLTALQMRMNSMHQSLTKMRDQNQDLNQHRHFYNNNNYNNDSHASSSNTQQTYSNVHQPYIKPEIECNDTEQRSNYGNNHEQFMPNQKIDNPFEEKVKVKEETREEESEYLPTSDVKRESKIKVDSIKQEAIDLKSLNPSILAQFGLCQDTTL